MITKKDFRESTCLKKIWNKIITWHGMRLATVQWDNNPWKIVDDGITFDQLTNRIEVKKPDEIFTSYERTYTPIKEFHTQEELWQYIKSLDLS